MLAPAADAVALLDAAVRSGLIPDRLRDRTAAANPADARAAADLLVTAGQLTRFQADRLLANRTDGFQLGPYLILEPIGKGRSGRVFKARHKTMGRLAAIKVLAPDRTADPAARDAFTREARLAARLIHPNVVTALDANHHADRMYLVLEYVDGADLGTMIRANGPAATDRACEYIRQAALGLAHAHAQGISHGSLTPGDLLAGRPGGLGPDDKPAVKVLNFGFGKLAAFDRAETGELRAAAAAVDYLAPEQLADPDRADPAADVFALGAVFYYLLAGRPPVADRGGLLHQTAGAVPVEQLRPDVPPAVAGLVRAMLASDPAHRPGMAAAAARLEPLADGSAVEAVEFDDLPATGASGQTYLTGLYRRPGDSAEGPSPFADLADTDEPTAAEAVTVGTGELTPLSTRRPRRATAANDRPAWLWPAAFGLAGLMVLAAGLAVGVVLRAAVK